MDVRDMIDGFATQAEEVQITAEGIYIDALAHFTRKITELEALLHEVGIEHIILQSLLSRLKEDKPTSDLMVELVYAQSNRHRLACQRMPLISSPVVYYDETKRHIDGLTLQFGEQRDQTKEKREEK